MHYILSKSTTSLKTYLMQCKLSLTPHGDDSSCTGYPDPLRGQRPQTWRPKTLAVGWGPWKTSLGWCQQFFWLYTSHPQLWMLIHWLVTYGPMATTNLCLAVECRKTANISVGSEFVLQFILLLAHHFVISPTSIFLNLFGSMILSTTWTNGWV